MCLLISYNKLQLSDLHIPWCRAVRVAPFSNRLAHAVPSDIQSLRCFANFEALRFSDPIRMLAENMVDRMVKKSSESGGRYVSVHLRFEEVPESVSLLLQGTVLNFYLLCLLVDLSWI